MMAGEVSMPLEISPRGARLENTTKECIIQRPSPATV